MDDSAVYRAEIRSALEGISGVEVIAAVHHGKMALDRLTSLSPDLLILDVEMPEMNGLETLAELRKRSWPGKVLMFSSASRKSADITLEALRLGAHDFVTKPGPDDFKGLAAKDKIKTLLEPKISALFSLIKQSKLASPPAGSYPKLQWELLRPKVVVIGASTGGPSVLEYIFSQLQGPLSCPVLIVQHMPALFTTSFAERLAKSSGVSAREGEHGETLKNNHIYVAPGDYHMSLTQNGADVGISLDQSAKLHSVRPAVDLLFQSAAQIYGAHCLGMVLTGMGVDGKEGALAIKERGGAVVIQSEATCTVFGMPGAVQAAGAFDQVASPDEVVAILRDKISFHLPEKGKRCG